MRNLTSIIVCGAEYLVLNTHSSPLEVACLVGILIGAIVYGWNDVRFSKTGYVHLAFNVVFTAAFQIYIKKLVKVRRDENERTRAREAR